MKKSMTLCVAAVMLLALCACGARTEPETVRSPYDGLIACLEAGDYDGARAMIDAMEKNKEPLETEIAETDTAAIRPPEVQPESVIHADIELVELTPHNVREYFEFTEEFHIGEQSSCTQYITLKEEYRDRLLSLEKAQLEISFQCCNAYGSIDLEEGEFQSDFYEPISQEKVWLELDNNGSAWLNGMIPYSNRGYFPEYAMDVEIASGTGTLILTAE